MTNPHCRTSRQSTTHTCLLGACCQSPEFAKAFRLAENFKLSARGCSIGDVFALIGQGNAGVEAICRCFMVVHRRDRPSVLTFARLQPCGSTQMSDLASSSNFPWDLTFSFQDAASSALDLQPDLRIMLPFVQTCVQAGFITDFVVKQLEYTASTLTTMRVHRVSKTETLISSDLADLAVVCECEGTDAPMASDDIGALSDLADLEPARKQRRVAGSDGDGGLKNLDKAGCRC